MRRKHPSEIFSEIQSFRKPSVRFLLAILPLTLTGLLIWQVGLGHEPSDKGLSNNEVIGWTIFVWIIYFRLVSVRLMTSISFGILRVSLKGLWTLRKIPLNEIKSAEIITYNAKQDYRGFGIRSNGRNRAYIARGDQGVMITPVNGSPVLIGSQRAVELYRSLFRH